MRIQQVHSLHSTDTCLPGIVVSTYQKVEEMRSDSEI